MYTFDSCVFKVLLMSFWCIFDYRQPRILKTAGYRAKPAETPGKGVYSIYTGSL